MIKKCIILLKYYILIDSTGSKMNASIIYQLLHNLENHIKILFNLLYKNRNHKVFAYQKEH